MSNSERVPGDKVPCYLVDVMSASQKGWFITQVLIWLFVVLAFWVWWARDVHIDEWWRFLVNSILMAWTFLLPGYFFFFVGRMKRFNPEEALPEGWLVAMVVTRAPSEPYEVVRETLVGMLEQEYPHDTWLADEDPTEECEAWCREHGVKLITRRGVKAYHRLEWPRRTRCKEGNLAYFYDQCGYDNYDFVCQMDADHRPGRGYLEAMLRPFLDPGVGYVSAPSICDRNAHRSWSARARLHAEALMHGPLQAGYSAGWAPLCIGSHYAVRTRSLREIGGLGPELAEDHSTTLLMNANGWRGVHALDAEAHGDGPESFSDCMTQEFQWSRSLAVLLLTLSPKVFGKLSPRLLVQFAFSQLWYPLFAGMMALSLVLPLVAVLTKTPWVRVNYLEFLGFFLLVNATLLVIVSWLRRNGWLRPPDIPLFSADILAFQFARWPWVFWGICAAVWEVLRKKKVQFRVTPKGVQEKPLPMIAVLPYLGFSVLTSAVAILIPNPERAAGYTFFLLLNAFIYIWVIRHVHRNHVGPVRYRWLSGFIMLPLLALSLRGGQAFDGIVWRQDPGISMTDLTVNLGIYDPNGDFDDSDRFAIDHLFVDWNADLEEYLLPRLGESIRRQRWPLITVEPWPAGPSPEDTERLFEDILAGRYDPQIKALSQVIRTFGHPLFVRWGHEMEMVTGRYPWAREDAAGYVLAYRYFVDLCRTLTSDVYFVWSPAGNKELVDYWPGHAHADVVGLSVFGFVEYDIKIYGRLRSFEEIFAERYNRVYRWGRPIMIAELGVDGGDAYQRLWMNQAFRQASHYPQLKTMVYFSARDHAEAWGEDYAIPDWTVKRGIFGE